MQKNSHITQKHKDAISKKLKGRKLSKTHREKISLAKKGIPCTEETRIKISSTRKNRDVAGGKNNPMYGMKGELSPSYGRNGEKHPMYGKTHSRETIEKMRKIKLGKKSPEHSERMSGKGNPLYGVRLYKEYNYNWRGGKSFEPYPVGWNKNFREQIRHRDGYKCQLCGMSEIENGRRLAVHHIDYEKFNIKQKNLISLCHRCHLKTNGKREYWKIFFSNMIKEPYRLKYSIQSI